MAFFYAILPTNSNFLDYEKDIIPPASGIDVVFVQLRNVVPKEQQLRLGDRQI